MSIRIEALKEEIQQLVPRLVELRQDLHKHPELGFEEERTQGVIRAWLEQHGYAPRDSAKTGLVADLSPDLVAGRANGRTVALRADIDCLPMTELTNLPYRSVHAGRAHKCGHDGHTAILMGTAAILARHKDALPGNVRLLFQPAEEGVRGGGARVMVAEGALEGVSEVYGLHNWPAWPLGEVRVKAGAMMAQVHSFEIELIGKGGHGSQPQLARDPIVAASHLVTALQTVVSRGFGYEGGAVLSVCSFQAGTTNNVIPERAKLSGTIRTFDAAATERTLARFREIIRGVSATFGVECNETIEVGYPVLMNDPGCAEVVRRVATEALGAAAVSDGQLPMAGGEDFAYFAESRPSAYFFLGAKRGEEDTPVCHHPDFDFDDRLIPLGIELFLRIVLDRLAASGAGH